MAEGTFPATEAAAAGAFEAPLRGPLLAITPAPEAVSGRRLKQIEVRCLPACLPARLHVCLPAGSGTAFPHSRGRGAWPSRVQYNSVTLTLLWCCIGPQALRRIAPALEVLAIGAGFRASAAPGPERGQP